MPENWWDKDPVAPSGGDNWWKQDPAGGGSGPPPPALADRKSTMSQGGQPRGWYTPVWEAVGNWYFGSPERRELQTNELGDDPKKVTGVGMTPTPSQMVHGTALMGSMVGGPAIASLKGSAILAEGAEAAAAAPEATGAIAKAAQWAAPRLRNAAVGALPGLSEGDTRTAKIGAAMGLLLPGGRASQEAVSEVSRLLKGGKMEEARVLIEAIRAAASKEAGAAPAAIASLEKAAAAEAAPVVEKAAAPVVSKAIDLGKEAVERHRRLVEFAKGIAAKNPKVGEKIHILVDEAGNPVRTLTRDEASAAGRKTSKLYQQGFRTTFIKNLWGSAAQMFD